MNFQPYDSDADWVLLACRSIWPLLVVRVVVTVRSDPSGFDESGLGTQPLPVEFDMRERLNVVDCGDLVYAFGMPVR